MSAAEETLKRTEASRDKSAPVINKFLDFISSVRFGVVILCILVALSVLGMVVIQQNVDGFDAYYATRTPAERALYGGLGLFDVYHSWYYNALLLVLSLNIVLASIDRFPGAWAYITNAKKTATRDFLLKLKDHAVVETTASDEAAVIEKLKADFSASGFSPVVSEDEITSYAVDDSGKKDFSRTETKRFTYVFGERGKWNRIGAYIVHVFLLVLFLGHFVALQYGFDADVALTPDTNPQVQRDFNAANKTSTIQLIRFNLDKKERYNVELPFTITCTAISQSLIDTGGQIGIDNTMDWHTQIRIDDPEYGQTVADISLNNPYTYRGYRFFQASTIAVGSASSMTLELTPTGPDGNPLPEQKPITVVLKRNESATLPDGTRIDYDNFVPDFSMRGNQVTTNSADYNNPAAILNVTSPAKDGKPEETIKVFAFANKLPDNAPIAAAKAGYKWHMKEFVKSPVAHVLSIKYDPFNAAFVAWYIGGFGLIIALGFIFFTSHRRVWAMVEPKDDGKFDVVFGGDANRNNLAFGDKFRSLVERFSGTNSTENKG